MSRMDEILANRVDRTLITVFDNPEDAKQAERDYWRSCTPEERLTALEMVRRNVYGYDENEQGLRGVFEVVERKKS
jgi:hypothetical protein